MAAKIDSVASMQTAVPLMIFALPAAAYFYRMSLYNQRGVSAQKEDVHAATTHIDKGLYPKAFCKVYDDLLGGDKDWVNVMHADGAGTKSILAYLYWKETGDLSVWKGIAQDAIVMNLDDLLCVGIYKNLLYSSSIDRNKSRIPSEVLKALIEGSQECLDALSSQGVTIAFLGGETADVGDVVKTVAVNGTMAARWKKDRLITNEKIKAGDVIVGLASYGQATYESGYNSGIGSNGLTSARHDMLSNFYTINYPESYDDTLPNNVVYIGTNKLTDAIAIEYNGSILNTTVGQLILSPTRTYAPVLKKLLTESFTAVHGLVHCSGGGQTKCLKYLPWNVRVVKDNLLQSPPLFDLIQKSSGADNREMYEVFNMGTRLEIYTDEKSADAIIGTIKSFGIEAQVIGRVEAADANSLTIQLPGETLVY